MTWLTAFALTQALEMPVAWWALRGRRETWRILTVAFAASGLTHPALWFLLPPLFEDYWTYVIVGEALVWSIEALLYALLLDPRRGPAAAVAANAFSCGAGLLIHAAMASS